MHPAPKNSCIGFCENCLTNLHKTYYIGLWGIVNIQLLLFYVFFFFLLLSAKYIQRNKYGKYISHGYCNI